MDKIDDNAVWFQIKRKVNELVEGYNEIMKLLEHYNLDRIDDDKEEKDG